MGNGKKMSLRPGFSIIMPTFNRAFCICEAVDSVLMQNYPDFELIVVDDGSSDGTDMLLKERYGAEMACGRLKYLRSGHEGVSAARNKGLRAATREWAGYLDTDNRMCADYFAVFENAVRTGGAKCYYAQIKHLNNRRVVGRAYDARAFCRWCLADMNAFVHHRSLYDELGGFDESMKRFVDWELMLRYSRKYVPVFVPRVVSLYNDSDEIKRISNSEDAEQARRIIYDRYLPAKLPVIKRKVLIVSEMFKGGVVPADEERVFREYLAFYRQRFEVLEKMDTSRFNLLVKVPEKVPLFVENKCRALTAFYDFVLLCTPESFGAVLDAAVDFGEEKAVVFEENGILPAGLPGLLEQTAAAAAGTVREMFGGRAVVISELDKAACLQ